MTTEPEIGRVRVKLGVASSWHAFRDRAFILLNVHHTGSEAVPLDADVSSEHAASHHRVSGHVMVDAEVVIYADGTTKVVVEDRCPC